MVTRMCTYSKGSNPFRPTNKIWRVKSVRPVTVLKTDRTCKRIGGGTYALR